MSAYSLSFSLRDASNLAIRDLFRNAFNRETFLQLSETTPYKFSIGVHSALGTSLSDVMVASGAGRKSFSGGTGNDIYLQTLSSDAMVVTETANNGFDTVIKFGAERVQLEQNVEQAIIRGAVSHFLGNEENNVVRIRDVSNLIETFGGDDIIRAPIGTNTIDGGAGNDAVIVNGHSNGYKFERASQSNLNEVYIQHLATGAKTLLKNIEYVSFNNVKTSVAEVVKNLTPIANSAPVAANDTVAINKGSTATINVLINDVDADGGPLTITSVTGATYGKVSFSPLLVQSAESSSARVSLSYGTLTYIADPDYVGTDTFQYTIRDAAGAISTATVSVAIKADVAQAGVLGTDAADSITLNAAQAPQVVSSLGGNDRITGHMWSGDVIYAGDGDDNVNGYWGNDKIYGGAGNDTLVGAANDDQLYGEDGNDYLDGGYESDKLFGGSGNDILRDDSGKNILDGGEGVDRALYDKTTYSAELITHNDNGTITFKQADGNTSTLSNIEFISFANGEYSVANKLFSSTYTNTGSAGASSGGGSSGAASAPASSNVIKAPDLQEAQNSNEIVGLAFRNNTASLSPSDFVTFGHTFVKGDLPANNPLAVNIAGVNYATQVNVMATHEDGSVRHAILTLKLPDLPASTLAQGMLVKAPAPPTGTDIGVDSILNNSNYSFQAKVELDGQTHVFDAKQMLSAAKNDGTLSTWMKGPLASEYEVSQKINDHLVLKMQIREYKDGEVRTDVSVENSFLYVRNISKETYNIELTQNGQQVFSQNNVEHHAFSNWHKQFWTDEEPSAQPIFDMDYLSASGAFGNYDLSTGIKEQAIIDINRAANNNSAILDNGSITQSMPTTGERDDIGPATRWMADYVVTQDSRALDTLMINADAAGSIPWHFIDDKTGDIVSIADRPNSWGTDYRSVEAYNGVPQTSINQDRAKWDPDTAHQPTLSFLPYLITGDKYYLDNLQAQANYGMISHNPGYRNGDDGWIGFGQVRAFAWTVRALDDAAWITPDNDKMKSYLSERLEYNWAQALLVSKDLGDRMGQLEGAIISNGNDISSWQNDFINMIATTAVVRGSEAAEKFLEWTDNYTVSRLLASDIGSDAYYGIQYYVNAREGKLDSNPLITTWQEYQHNITGGVPASDPAALANTFQSNYNTGYTAYALAATANSLSVFGSLDAAEAYATVYERATLNFTENAKYHIVPRLADGTLLTADQHFILSNGADTYNGTSKNELVIGKEGNDILRGNAGIDILVGNEGDDQLFGGDGDDYLVGGENNDKLYGGAGNDALRGGIGRDELFGDAGNDLLYADNDDARVDGGTGLDTLIVQMWRDFDFNLTGGVFSSIEQVDLRNQTNNTEAPRNVLRLDITKILELSDTDIVRVFGDAGFDQVEVTGRMTKLADSNFNGVVMSHYQADNGAHLYVQSGVAVTNFLA